MEKEIEISFGCLEMNFSQNRNLPRYVAQQLRSLGKSRADCIVHVKEEKHKILDTPLIVVPAPCPKRHSSLKMTETRKSKGCFGASKMREYESGTHPIDSMLSVPPFHRRSPKCIAKSRKITSQRLPRLQTSIDLLIVPEVLEGREVLQKKLNDRRPDATSISGEVIRFQCNL